MSRQASGAGAIALGVGIGVFAVVSQQYWLLFTSAALVAGGVASLTMSPNTDSPEQSQNQDLQAATATEGIPVPVVFGEIKLAGNFMRYVKDFFRVIEVRGESGVSGKGGGSAPDTVVGHKFFLTYEYALCMGEIDEVVQVWSQPGEKKMMGDTPIPLAFGGSDFLEITLDEVDPDDPAGKQGGLIRIYKGSDDQTRINNNDEDPYQVDGMNYRNLCWVLFIDFQLGRFPQPRSYQFILRRLPVCKRNDDTIVTGIKTRGSDLVQNTAYNDANPAAVVYEILTNKLWGRGMSSDLIDEQSFIDCSDYFAAQNIGMSFSVRNPDKLGNLLDTIRQHVKSILVWDEDKLKLKCLLDRVQTNVGIKDIAKSDFINISIQRPMWDSTINEVRVEYNSKDRNYRPDMVAAQNLANIQQTGRINTRKVTLNGITDFNTARRQAQRILDEISVPIATLTGKLNRYEAAMEVGDTFRLILDDWTPDGTAAVTTYWTLMSLADSSEDDDTVEIEAVMYPHIPATDQSETGDISPDLQWENLPDIPKDDVDLFEPIRTKNDEILPIIGLEMPISWSKRAAPREQTIIVGEKVNPNLVGMDVLFNRSPSNDNSFQPLGTSTAFSVSGELLAAFEGGKSWDRSLDGIFFELVDSTREDEIFGIATQVQTENDDLETLESSGLDYMIIDGEIMQVGYVELVGANQYRARNLIRGLFGTLVRRHEAGASCFFVRNFPNPIDTVARASGFMRLRALPVGTGGVTQLGDLFNVNIVNATDRVSLVAHPYKKNNGVQFVADTMPLPLAEGTTYYVRDRVTDSFKISATPNGSAIDITTDGVNVQVQAVVASDFFLETSQYPPEFDQEYVQLGARPYPPAQVVSASYSDPLLTVVVKPRYGEKGAGMFPFFGEYNATLDTVDGAIVDTNKSLQGLDYLLWLMDSSGALVKASPGSVTSISNIDLVSKTGGEVTMTFFIDETSWPPAGVSKLRFFQQYNSRSVNFIELDESEVT